MSIVIRGRSPSVTMLTRGRLSCLANPQECHICFIIPNNPPPPPSPRAPKVHDKLKLTNSLGQWKSNRFTVLTMLGYPICFIIPNHVWSQLGWDFTFFSRLRHLFFFIVVLNTNIIQLWKVAFCSGLVTIRHAWGPWKHHVLNNIGNHETAPWQRVLMRRLLDSGC